MIVILGPTASGKTALAVAVARAIGSELISADSRQIYRGMDIGTGKDLADYGEAKDRVPYHLIDIRDAGYRYNLFEYQRDFHQCYAELKARGIDCPVLCGGTGMYIEAILKGYRLPDVPANPELRQSLQSYTLDELEQKLSQYGPLHNRTDIDSCQRAIRAIEIAEYCKQNPALASDYPPIPATVCGVMVDRELRRKRISQRLQHRLEEEDMLGEVQRLLDSGISPDDLIYYGLEYKFLTLHLIGELSYKEMFEQLEIAIHQFAKRQMTWFRGMARRGTPIHWIDGHAPLEERVAAVLALPR